MRGGHEQLRSLDDIVFVRVVLEHEAVVMGPRPVADALQH